MLVIPAIDIKGGRCVRLRQGRMDEETVFSDAPEAMALQWVSQGAERLHLVDLDGAVSGKPENREVIRRVVEAAGVPVQLGGGIREMAVLEAYLALGIRWAILGTAACKDPDFAATACRRFPGRIILGLDAREGRVSVQGWTEDTALAPETLARRFADQGAAAIVYTDIRRDGMQSGPNVEATGRLARAAGIPVIASGGISGIEDVLALLPLARDGVVGMITGRAIYEGTLDLAEAIGAAKRSTGAWWNSATEACGR